MIDEERAAIYEFDAGFTKLEAEEMAHIEDVDRSQTLTAKEFQTLQAIRKSAGLMISSQDKDTKGAITRLAKRGLVKVEPNGWVSELTSSPP